MFSVLSLIRLRNGGPVVPNRRSEGVPTRTAALSKPPRPVGDRGLSSSDRPDQTRPWSGLGWCPGGLVRPVGWFPRWVGSPVDQSKLN